MRYLLLFVSLLTARLAAAAGVAGSSAPMIAAFIIALGCIAVATKFWLDRQTLVDSRADLEQRYRQSERTVQQLQVEREELEESVARKKRAIAEMDEQHRQTHDMLVTLRGQVERVARIDGHTGVANQQQFHESLTEEIKRSVRQRKPLTLLIGELDFFNDYVDINGPERGDFALQSVASKISNVFRRAGDLVARVGDARFAVILPETDLRTGERFGEKMRRSIYDLCLPFPASDAADRITISVGAVTVPPKRLHDHAEVAAMAERALTDAQDGGYNQVSMASNVAA